MKAHIKNIHQKIKCNQCEEEFSQVGYLKRHMKLHTTTEEIIRFECEFCVKDYSRKDNLLFQLKDKHQHTNQE